MAAIVEQLLQKMGLQNEPKIVNKTIEFLRLLELRSANMSAALNVYAKCVLCIDLAAAYLGITFDQENALKMSGFRKTQYATNRRMFEKLLDLKKTLAIKDICIKLGINDVAQKATELLELYKNIPDNEALDIDLTHPQYPAMAIYQSCKIEKRRISKQKILAISHLRPSQWVQLEKRWDMIIANQTEPNMKIMQTARSEENKDEVQKLTPRKCSYAPEVEDYEVWKYRMLSLAQLQLNEKSEIGKENIEKRK